MSPGPVLQGSVTARCKTYPFYRRIFHSPLHLPPHRAFLRRCLYKPTSLPRANILLYIRGRRGATAPRSAVCIKKAVLCRSTLPKLVLCTKRDGVGFFGRVSRVLHRAGKPITFARYRIFGSIGLGHEEKLVSDISEMLRMRRAINLHP